MLFNHFPEAADGKHRTAEERKGEGAGRSAPPRAAAAQVEDTSLVETPGVICGGGCAVE